MKTAEELVEDSFSSLQNLWNASVLVLVVWVLFLPSAIARLNEYDAALQLTAWKLLTDLSSQKLENVINGEQCLSDWDQLESHKTSSPLLFDLVCSNLQGSSCTGHCYPLDVQTLWPQIADVYIRLSPEQTGMDPKNPDRIETSLAPAWLPNKKGFSRSFRIVTTVKSSRNIEVPYTGEVPFDSYVITIFFDKGGKGYTAVSAGAPRSQEFDLYHIGYSIDFNVALKEASRPGNAETALYYAKLDDFTKLNAQNLSEMQRDADLSRGSLSLGGIDLNIGFAFAGVGVITAVLAFLMLGPLMVLRFYNNQQTSTSWILAIGTFGRPGVEGVVFVIWLIWTCLPLVVIVLQLCTNVPTPSSYMFLKYVNEPLLLFSSGVFLCVSMSVRRLRRNSVLQ
jgi:hypothetical protein